jgi:hypothetical protein
VGALEDRRVGVLLSVRGGQPWQSTVEQLSRTAREADPDAVVSVGCEVTDLSHDCDLEVGEQRTEVHVSLIALDILRMS